MYYISIHLLQTFLFFLQHRKWVLILSFSITTLLGSVSSIIQWGGDSERPDPFWSPYLLSFPISSPAWASLIASCYSEHAEDPWLTRGRTQLPPSLRCTQSEITLIPGPSVLPESAEVTHMLFACSHKPKTTANTQWDQRTFLKCSSAEDKPVNRYA